MICPGVKGVRKRGEQAWGIESAKGRKLAGGNTLRSRKRFEITVKSATIPNFHTNQMLGAVHLVKRDIAGIRTQRICTTPKTIRTKKNASVLNKGC